MAGDWIKVEKTTPRKPEIFGIAETLKVSLDEAFGICFRFWVWCDDQMSDGTAVRITAKLLDDAIGVSGFCAAISSVGWLKEEEGVICIPNFDRHLGKAAKIRADSSRRQRVSRDCRKNVTIKRDNCHRVSIPDVMQRAIFDRDKVCVYCGWSEKDVCFFGKHIGASLCLDHVVPVSRGGETVIENLVTSCSVCNMEKSDRTPEEAGMYFRFGERVSQIFVTELLPEKRREEYKKENTKRKSFQKPTVQEILDCCREKSYTIDAQEFFDYYESVNWHRGKTKLTNWRLALASWHRKTEAAAPRPRCLTSEELKHVTSSDICR